MSITHDNSSDFAAQLHAVLGTIAGQKFLQKPLLSNVDDFYKTSPATCAVCQVFLFKVDSLSYTYCNHWAWYVLAKILSQYDATEKEKDY